MSSVLHNAPEYSVSDLNVKCKNQIIFIRHAKTKKLLRGSLFFSWVNSWTRAWPATPSTFIERLNSGSLDKFGINCLSDVEIITNPDDLVCK